MGSVILLSEDLSPETYVIVWIIVKIDIYLYPSALTLLFKKILSLLLNTFNVQTNVPEMYSKKNLQCKFYEIN